jgi:hypothetical protein
MNTNFDYEDIEPIGDPRSEKEKVVGDNNVPEFESGRYKGPSSTDRFADAYNFYRFANPNWTRAQAMTEAMYNVWSSTQATYAPVVNN